MDYHSVGELEVLKGRPRQDEAKTLLTRIAKQVEPIMKKYKWRVGRLCEFFPSNPGLHGMNCNRGQKVLIRLRPHFSPDGFLPVETLLHTMLHELVHNEISAHDDRFYKKLDESVKALMHTMLHELVHNEISAHDDRFYKKLDELTAECEGMMAKGFNAFNDAHIPFDGQGQVLGSGGQVKARSKDDLRDARVKAVEKRMQDAKRGTPSGGVRLGGAAGGDGKVLNPRGAVRRAAENRRLDHERCRTAHEQAAASAPTGDKDAWVCGVCTLRNGHHAVTCAACDSPKTAADATQHTVISMDDPGVADASIADAKGGSSSGGGGGGGGDGGGNDGEREAKSAVKGATARKPSSSHAAAASKGAQAPSARTMVNRQPPNSLLPLSTSGTHTRPPSSSSSSSTTTITSTDVHPHTRPPPSSSASIPPSSSSKSTTIATTTSNSSRTARAAQLLGPVGGWVCTAEACGRMNAKASDRCSRCGMARTKKHNSGGGFRGAAPWDCDLCTLRNAATADQCAVCGVPRPSPAGHHTPATSTSTPSRSDNPTMVRSGGGDSGGGVCGEDGGGGGVACGRSGGTHSDGGAGSRRGAVWACTCCTLQNQSAHAMCAACGTQRPWQKSDEISDVVDLTDD